MIEFSAVFEIQATGNVFAIYSVDLLDDSRKTLAPLYITQEYASTEMLEEVGIACV